MNEEEKKTIEYLKTRLYGNEGCKYIDVAQEDLRIFINLVDRKEKDIEGWKKYCEEIEEERIEMSNKNCELEFEVEKLHKENEELKNKYNKALSDVIVGVDLDNNYISTQKVKDNIEELKAQYKTALEENSTEAFILKCQIIILQELIEEREEE